MKKRDEKLYNDPWDRDFYETGSTKPPKQHGGLIAFLLVLVLLLGGLSSALGIINVRLLQQLAAGQEDPDTLYLFDDEAEQSQSTGSTQPVGEERMPKLGLQGQTVSDFDRRFYELPRGVLVTDVAENRVADQAGIRNGDVIVSVDSRRIGTHEELEAALGQCAPGQQIRLEFYRQQTRQQMSVTITISEEEKQ